MATASSDPQLSGETIRYSGWLKKYGGLFNKMKQNRWVKLTDTQLIRSKEKDGIPRGTIDLASAVTAKNLDGISFTITAAGNKFTFVAENKSECEIWINHIEASREKAEEEAKKAQEKEAAKKVEEKAAEAARKKAQEEEAAKKSRR